jgi:hypothetical protein
MGRTGTSLVAAAVCVLGAAAVLDAVVGGGSPGEATAPTPTPTRAEVVVAGAEFLRDESVAGLLLFSDVRCRVRTLDLMSLEQRDPRATPSCTLSRSLGGAIVTDAGVIAPREAYTARCSNGFVEIWTLAGYEPDQGPALGRRISRVPGCSPAWAADDTLTVVRDGEAVDVGRPDLPGHDVVILSREDLGAVFGPPLDFHEPQLVEIAWMDENLLAAVVRDGGGEGDVLAIFDGRRLVGTSPSPYQRLLRLRVSPRATYVAARVGDPAGLVVLDRHGEMAPLGLRGHAVTWSRDETFTAVAADDGIYVFETAGRPNRFARIPVVALDLAWL